VTVDPIAAALTPFWRGTEMLETLTFIRSNPHAPPQARLLFRPDKILRLTSVTRDMPYEPGRDYIVDLDTGVVTLPPGSRIKFRTPRQLAVYAGYALPFPPDDIQGFHFQQVEAAYTHAPDQWTGYAPAVAEAHLTRTLKKLRAAEPVKLALMGDSIADGGCSSKSQNIPPGAPPFGDQIAQALERTYGSPIAFENVAHGGWSSGTGAKQAREENLGARRPDLVMVAFGMNDVTFANAADRTYFSPANYGKHIRAIIGRNPRTRNSFSSRRCSGMVNRICFHPISSRPIATSSSR